MINAQAVAGTINVFLTAFAGGATHIVLAMLRQAITVPRAFAAVTLWPRALVVHADGIVAAFAVVTATRQATV